MNNYGLAVDQVDAMSVAFEGGAVGTVGGTANARRAYSVQLSVYCQDGAYVSDTLTRQAALWGPGGEREDLAEVMGSTPAHAVTLNFIDVILGRAENGSPGEIGWRTVELLDAAYRSAALDGQPIRVDDVYMDE
jgi:predicted dehydrogenase